MHSHALSGRSILVLEDEPLIALDIVESLKPTGAQVLTAGQLLQALRLAADAPLAAAVVDFKIGDGDSAAICDLLKQRRIPFLIYSGYDVLSWPADVPVGQKPATSHKLVTSVTKLLQGDAPLESRAAGRA